MRKPTHMTNGIGLRRLIKFGDVGAYIYIYIYVTESGVAERQTKKYIYIIYDPLYNIRCINMLYYIIITATVIFSSFTSPG